MAIKTKMETTLSSWDQNMHYGLSCTEILSKFKYSSYKYLVYDNTFNTAFERSQFSCCKSHSLVRVSKKHKTFYINIYPATKQKWIADADWDNKIQRDIFNLCLHLYSTCVYFISKETIAILAIHFVHSLAIYIMTGIQLYDDSSLPHTTLYEHRFSLPHIIYSLSMEILTLLSYLPPL